MNTNFFNQIAQLDFTGNLQLNISKGADNTLIVSTMLQNEQCGDNAKDLIMPFNLRGTAQELDEGYFEKITKPIETVSGLMDNMEAFLKQVEEAKKKSAMEKEKADKEKKEREAKDKKFKDGMAKADELEKEGKFREAWTAVPEPSLFPEKADEIRKRRSALSAKFAPDLFGATDKQEQPQTPPEASYPNYQADKVEEEMQSEEEETEY